MFAILSGITIGVNVCITAKNAIILYKDTRKLKNEYIEHKKTQNAYKNIQVSPNKNLLTESQYERDEKDFVIIKN